MASVADPLKQPTPIDLNALHTPHKLASFVVNVPSRKAEFAFLFNEDNNKINSDATNTLSRKSLNTNNMQFLSVRSTSLNLKPPTIIKKHKSKSKKRAINNIKAPTKTELRPNLHLNKDEEDMTENIYNAEIDSVGPANTNIPSLDRKPTINDLPTTPVSVSGASKANVFGDDPNVSNAEETRDTKLGIIRHQTNVSTTSTIVSEPDANNISIPNASDIGMIGDVPIPMEPIMPPRFGAELSALQVETTESTFKYEVSMIETPTLDDSDLPSIALINQVSLDPFIDQLSDGVLSDSTADVDKLSKEDLMPLPQAMMDMHDIKDMNDDTTSSEDTEVDEEAFGYLEEEEENICIRIGKVLYENSWTGDMISSANEFSRREYNALLNVDNIPTDSYISNLVWKIIYYSQKKTKDDLINEDREHIKWYWFDSNDMDSDWKWRKYNVMICQWITEQFEKYLRESVDDKLIDFKECQKKLSDMHREKGKKNKYDSKENEKEQEDKPQKNKKITIDPYFGKSNYDHYLFIEREKRSRNILLWHKITHSDDTGHQYYREIRLDHKLLGIKQDMIVQNYQPNPSPFAVPPLLAVDS